ncbi:MAG: Ig-like domain-containing protein [Gammaproteobacteria bacterium]|nr:Ig-like domain-containing protein [Gammaproteobacteria bacterium]
MLKKLISLCVVVASAVLMSCGGSNTITGGGAGGNAQVASVQVLAAATTLDSDQSGLTTIDITAIVRDANNVVLSDVPVAFGANANGSVSVVQLNTDSNGQALARLSNGTDASNRAITVTATAGSASGTVIVNVVKTEVTVDCPDTVALSTVASCTVRLQDSKAAGIAAATVNITSSLNNALSATSVLTNGSGQASFTVTANNSGSDTITVSALGDSGIDIIVIPAVTGDSFSVTTPAANGLEIPLNTNQTVTVAWTISGAPQNGQTMTFASSRGSFFLPATVNPANPPTAVTAGAGEATLDIRSSTAGLATIAISRPGGGIATRNVEFVATVANSLDVQAEPSSVRTGNQSQLTAIVRDPTGNLVKNKIVNFSLSNNTGGVLSSPLATTGSDGRASVVFTAGTEQSALNGVVVTATVQEGATTLVDTVNLTVTGQALAISLGTGNELFELGTATFAKEWVIFVTDADGNAVANKQVTVSIRSVNFYKGNLYVPVDGDSWVKEPEPANFLPLRCPDEDLNFNGILDPGEDLNISGLLEAGNIALVAPVGAAAPAGSPCSNLASSGSTQASIATGNDGRARVCVLYPQNYNLWLDARIQARASVQGTEFSKSATFLLEALASDMRNINASPPGVVSPFGDVDTSLGASEPACTQSPPP